MFILDTDAITHHQNAHAILSARVSHIPSARLFTTSVTVEEQLKGRLSYLNTHRNEPHKSAQGHAALVRTIYYFNQWNILLFDEEADTIVRQLRMQRVRIGTQDLRIAAIALLYGFTVVTNNIRDFAQVPNLNVEDWTASPQ